MSEGIRTQASAIILCGGLGTRLRTTVPDVPKALAPVRGRPFLDILLAHLKREGVRDVILAIGHGGERIKAHCARVYAKVKFSEETAPLGTGGALKKALSLADHGTVLVLNGDTHCPVSYDDFLLFHASKGALLSMVVAKKNRDDVGGVHMGADNMLLEYSERPKAGAHSFMSAGVYAVGRQVRAHMLARDEFSFEYDALPALVGTRRCFGYATHVSVIDIGTPERYRKAQDILSV